MLAAVHATEERLIAPGYMIPFLPT